MNAEQLQADFESHHIEGYARANGQYFSAPLISPVIGNLWQGGCINRVQLPADFKHVVSLYPWEKYDLGPNTDRVELEWYDFAELPDMQQLTDTVDLVAKYVADGKTLVHCQAGLNRSGLVAATYLVRYAGMTGKQAVELLRERRSPQVLCNRAFENWVLAQ